MSIREAFLIAVAAMREHRLRTALGAVGVAMAVAMTLTSLGVNEGARRAAQAEVDQLGIDTVVITGPAGSLTLQDADALGNPLPYEAVMPVLEVEAPVRGSVRGRRAEVTGVTMALDQIRPVRLSVGRFISAADEFNGARVCVIGGRIARELFDHSEAAAVRIGHDWFTVVGVASADAADADRIFVPISALLPRRAALHLSQPISAIWVRTAPGAGAEAEIALRQALARRRAGVDYQIAVARDLVEARDRTQRIFARVTAMSGLLLFLLGGAAITNGLLSSVVERTREIGLRRAVGATRREIVSQFLFEALVICGIGAVAGAAGGVLMIFATQYRGWAVAVPWSVVALIPAVAALVAVAAGTYPAIRAASIQPIDAVSRG